MKKKKVDDSYLLKPDTSGDSFLLKTNMDWIPGDIYQTWKSVSYGYLKEVQK